ncbi:hypothetical protein PspLS_00557 [Pyricularia sp. CBS 133598]|nr:hypothetical protein PspLS_00557 [Pyricularia sp. CBS 133598]
MTTSTKRKAAGVPALTESETTRLIDTIKDWTIARGLSVRPPPSVVAANADPAGILATSVPVTLFPSPFPANCFQQAHDAQKPYNELYAKISQDEDFIRQMVEEVAGGDDFIAKLWETHCKVKEEGYSQQLSLGLFRSDYMVHQDLTDSDAVPQVRQVEFNTIASSFGGLSAQTSLLHQHLALAEYPLLQDSRAAGSLNLPDNRSTCGLAAGIRAAFTAYGGSDLGHDRCVIFLVQDGERNVFDQRHLEYEVQRGSNGGNTVVPVFRLPFSQILKHTSIADGPKRQLLYRLPSNPVRVFEVAVVYMRSGYGPGDYPDDEAWQGRLQLERSNAIKCPTVLTQLAGMKKVQQVLATPPSSPSPFKLGRFVPEKTPAWESLWGTFANIYPMDESEAGLEGRRLALDPELCVKHVLKPQREGGGNNHYKAAIPGFLASLPDKSHWNSYILMELITPPPVGNVILRNGEIEQGGVICELGVFGTCLWNSSTGEMLRNEQEGYLLRTKGDQSEEGGVAAGFGCMDSVALV